MSGLVETSLDGHVALCRLSRPDARNALSPELMDELATAVEGFDADSVTLRLPQDPQLSRVGGMLCGQAMMAAADTAMVLALINQFGEFRPCTTVQMNTSFLRPLAGQDALVQARVVRAGKSLAFGEIDVRGAQDGKSASRASVTYALL